MSLLISGDLHGDASIRRVQLPTVSARLADWETIRCLIVVGDWGVVWNDSPVSVAQEKRLLAIYDKLPWETLVLLGNHEGFDRIERLPWTSRLDGPVRQASTKVFILQHGNIYTIEGKRLFVFGGGDSIDKGARKPYLSWWPQEIPTMDDFYRARATLAKSARKIDYVLTHTVPDKVIDEMRAQSKLLFGNRKFEDPTVRMLDQLEPELTEAKAWYFGHFHTDFTWGKFRCLDDDLVLLKSEGEA
jgi:hypothetical protein